MSPKAFNAARDLLKMTQCETKAVWRVTVGSRSVGKVIGLTERSELRGRCKCVEKGRRVGPITDNYRINSGHVVSALLRLILGGDCPNALEWQIGAEVLVELLVVGEQFVD